MHSGMHHAASRYCRVSSLCCWLTPQLALQVELPLHMLSHSSGSFSGQGSRPRSVLSQPSSAEKAGLEPQLEGDKAAESSAEEGEELPLQRPVKRSRLSNVTAAAAEAGPVLHQEVRHTTLKLSCRLLPTDLLSSSPNARPGRDCTLAYVLLCSVSCSRRSQQDRTGS